MKGILEKLISDMLLKGKKTKEEKEMIKDPSKFNGNSKRSRNFFIGEKKKTTRGK